MTESKRRPFARMNEVKAGDILIPDDGFDCLQAGLELRVLADDSGRLYVNCLDTKHYLDGQLPINGEQALEFGADALIGFYCPEK